MLTMREVSRYFDRTIVTDPDTGAELFRAQFANYDGSKRDAYAAYRRIMSVDPDVVIPVDRCIAAMGHTWILGDGHPEGWEQLHRRKFVAHRALGGARLYTLAGFLDGDPPRVTWGDIQWLGTTAEEGISSALPDFYLAILPDNQVADQYDIIEVGGTTILVRAAAHFASGFMEARGYQQPADALQAVVILHRKFNPATGGYDLLASASAPSVKARWQELFQYTDQLDERFQEGDAVLAVPAGTIVQMSDRLERAGEEFLIQNLTPMAGVLVIHVRPAGP